MKWEGWMIRFKQIGPDKKMQFRFCETEEEARSLTAVYKSKGMYADHYDL